MKQFWCLLGFVTVTFACQTPSQPKSNEASPEVATHEPPRLSARRPPFLDMCKSASTPAGVRHTIDILKSQISIVDCDEAFLQLQKLDQLDLTGLQLTDLTPLASFPQLRLLRLGNNQIKSIDALALLTQLEELQLNDNELEDINALSSLAQLKVLDLGHTQITSIKPVQTLTRLEWLDVSQNKITDISFLPQANALWYLSVANNRIESIDAVTILKQLRELYIQGNRIRDLSPLRGLKDLEGLVADDNPISLCPRGGDVSPALDAVCSEK